MRIDRGSIPPPPLKPEPETTSLDGGKSNLSIAQKISYTLAMLLLALFVLSLFIVALTENRVLLEIVSAIYGGLFVVFLFALFVHAIIVIWRS